MGKYNNKMNYTNPKSKLKLQSMLEVSKLKTRKNCQNLAEFVFLNNKTFLLQSPTLGMGHFIVFIGLPRGLREL